MKRRHYIALAIVLGGIALCSWIHAHPRQLPYDQCSEVFLRYKDADGVSAAFLKDFRINDSVNVDVTMLQARDSAVWAGLIISICHDGNSDDYMPLDLFFNIVEETEPVCSAERGRKNKYCVVASFMDLTVGVFHLENEQQKYAIVDRYIGLLKNQKEKNITNKKTT